MSDNFITDSSVAPERFDVVVKTYWWQLSLG